MLFHVLNLANTTIYNEPTISFAKTCTFSAVLRSPQTLNKRNTNEKLGMYCFYILEYM